LTSKCIKARATRIKTSSRRTHLVVFIQELRDTFAAGRYNSATNLRQENKRTWSQAMEEKASTEKLLDDLKAVVNDAEELLKASAGQAGERMSAARARAEASVRAARQRMSEVQDDVLLQTKEIAEEADAYVRKNPWQAVGIAAVAGIVVGLMLRR
jgi:ElaB/YqjD/DUF883 family membrane-anchored ribosome-binding protein